MLLSDRIRLCALEMEKEIDFRESKTFFIVVIHNSYWYALAVVWR